MKIKNKKSSANYVNFKDNGNPRKLRIAAGTIVDIPTITKATQIINFGDFKRGFFEIVSEISSEVVENTDKIFYKKTTSKKSISTKNKTEDSLEKVEKEVKNYTDGKE